MDKEVLITIGGMMFAGENNDNVDVISPGQYYYRRDRHYMVYEEVVEDSSEVIRNLIWVSPMEMVVRKSGAINTEMVFRPNEATQTHYNTPFGAVDLVIHTKRFQMRESENRLDIQVEYTLEMDYEILSENHLSICVQSRKDGNFSLRSK